MLNFNQTNTDVLPSSETMAKDPGLRKFMLGIYQKMALGLVLTAVVSYAVLNSTFMLGLLYTFGTAPDGRPMLTGYTPLGWIAAFAPMGLSFISGMFMQKLDAAISGFFYWLFVVIMGISLASIAFLYTGESIARVFMITAIAFGGLSLIGYTTKVNMTGWRTFLYMGVLGLIAAGIANIFFQSSMVSLITAVIGVLLFSALIAYQTQSLKITYYETPNLSDRQMAALTYIGALGLYINFINLFLSLLRLFGSRD